MADRNKSTHSLLSEDTSLEYANGLKPCEGSLRSETSASKGSSSNGSDASSSGSAHNFDNILQQDANYEPFSPADAAPKSPASRVDWVSFSRQIREIGDPIMTYSFIVFETCMKHYYKSKKSVTTVFTLLYVTLLQYIITVLDFLKIFYISWKRAIDNTTVALVNQLVAIHDWILERLYNAFQFCFQIFTTLAIAVKYVLFLIYESFREFWRFDVVEPFEQASNWVRSVPFGFFYLEVEAPTGFTGSALGLILIPIVVLVWIKEFIAEYLASLRSAIIEVFRCLCQIFPSTEQVTTAMNVVLITSCQTLTTPGAMILTFYNYVVRVVPGKVVTALKPLFTRPRDITLEAYHTTASYMPSGQQVVRFLRAVIKTIPMWLVFVGLLEYFEFTKYGDLVTSAIKSSIGTINFSPLTSATASSIAHVNSAYPEVIRTLSAAATTLSTIFNATKNFWTGRFSHISMPAHAIGDMFTDAFILGSKINKAIIGSAACAADFTSTCAVKVALSFAPVVTHMVASIKSTQDSLLPSVRSTSSSNVPPLKPWNNEFEAPKPVDFDRDSPPFETLGLGIDSNPISTINFDITSLFMPADRVQQLYPPVAESIAYSFYYSLTSGIITDLGQEINRTSMADHEKISYTYNDYANGLHEYGETISTLYDSVATLVEMTFSDLNMLVGEFSHQRDSTSFSRYLNKQTTTQELLNVHLDRLFANTSPMVVRAEKAIRLFEKLHVKYSVLRHLRREELQRTTDNLSHLGWWCGILDCASKREADRQIGLLVTPDEPIQSEEGHENILQLLRILKQLRSDVKETRKLDITQLHNKKQEYLTLTHRTATELKMVHEAMKAVMQYEINDWSNIKTSRLQI